MSSRLTERHIIWSNMNLNFDDWKEDLQNEYPNLSEDELYCKMYDLNNEYLEDERVNLNIQLNESIIIIADIGRWNGRFSGYKVIDSGNIKDCLYSDSDYANWYVDKYGDLRSEQSHHDGTNYLLYRVFKDNVSDIQKENFLNKIYNGTVTRQDISRVTKRIGDDIAKVYGFEINKCKKDREKER